MHPFKNNFKNYQELLLIINLQVVYTVLLYDNESVNKSIIFDTLIAIAAIHLLLIVLYHVITYVHGGVIRKNLILGISRLTRYLNGLYGREQVQQFEQDNLTRERIPEVTHHYDEFREPLVGQSVIVLDSPPKSNESL